MHSLKEIQEDSSGLKSTSILALKNFSCSSDVLVNRGNVQWGLLYISGCLLELNTSLQSKYEAYKDRYF